MDFLGGSIRIGRLFDVDVRVHMLYLIWMGLELARAGDSWRIELLFLGLLFFIILVHEFGHCFGARAVGGDARQILMWPLGGLAYAHAPMTPWAQFVTVAAGPLVNVIFCVGAALALMISTGQVGVVPLNPLNGPMLFRDFAPWQDYVAWFYWINLMILCFNLLPIYPLDGGQLFMTILWPWIGLHRATDVACKIGIGGAVVLGVLAIQHERFMLLAIAFFGAMTCWQRLQALKYGMVVDERIAGIAHVRRQRGASWWSRMFGRRTHEPRPRPKPPTTENPNPGAWQATLREDTRLDHEVDRILQKVHDHGMRSLTYIERQTLERATRMRQEREQAFDRETRL